MHKTDITFSPTEYSQNFIFITQALRGQIDQMMKTREL